MTPDSKDEPSHASLGWIAGQISIRKDPMAG
jgi:hypothetical protein